MSTAAVTQNPAPQMVPMLDDKGQPVNVASDRVEAAKAYGYTPAVKMIDQQGKANYVAGDRVQAARAANYAVAPDHPGVVKAVDYNKGTVNYILPSEEESFHGAGQAIVKPDGSIRYPIIKNSQGVIAQDPIEEAKAHERVYQALNAEEKSRNQRFELKEAGKAGLKATAATALGVMGAGPAAAATETLLAPSVIPVAGGTGFGGAAASEVLGPSLLAKTGVEVAKFAAKQVLGHADKIGIGYLLLKNLMRGK